MILAVALAWAEADTAGDTEVEPAYPSSPPISIDDAETVERGHVEINLTMGAEGGAEGWSTESPLVDANYGLTDNIHVNAEIPLTLVGGAAPVSVGLGQAAVAVKVRLVHLPKLQLAVHPAVALPPIPSVSVEPDAPVTFTLPVVLDVALGDTGAGVGVQLSRTFSPEGAWGAAVGFATPVADGSVVMFDYTQDAAADLTLGEGWFEVGFVHERLFGAEALTLLTSLGRSTEGGSAAMVGVQVGI